MDLTMMDGKGLRRWRELVTGKNGRILFDRPKPTAGCNANGRRRRRRRREKKKREGEEDKKKKKKKKKREEEEEDYIHDFNIG
jgi:hypothetical protein